MAVYVVITGVLEIDSSDETIKMMGHILTFKGVKHSIIDIAAFQGEAGKNYQAGKERVIQNYISQLETNRVQYVIVKLSNIDILREDFLDIRFDILVINANGDKTEFTDNEKNITTRLASTMKKDGIVIINSDVRSIFDFLSGINCNFITYGFNSKSSITTSSVGDLIEGDFFLCSLQRSVKTISNKTYPPQEIKIDSTHNLNENIYALLSAVAFSIVADIEIISE